MARVRWLGLEFEIITFNPDGTFYVRDAMCNVTTFELDPAQEIQCDFCKGWANHAGPVDVPTGVWRCYGGSGPCDGTVWP
jgi:hypothetical protein